MRLRLVREDTVPVDEDQDLFLGFWACPEDRMFDPALKVVPYHYDDRQLLEDDYYLSLRWADYLIESLSVCLNDIHEVQWSLRSWRILLMPWVLRASQVMLDRYRSLASVNADDITSIIPSVSRRYLPLQNFMQAAVWTEDNDSYNAYLYSLILPRLNKNVEIQDGEQYEELVGKRTLKGQCAAKLTRYLNKVLSSKRTILSPSIFKKEWLKIWLKSRGGIGIQLPIWDRRNFSVDTDMRARLKDHLNTLSHQEESDIFECVITLLSEQFPRSFLEGFSSYMNRSEYGLSGCEWACAEVHYDYDEAYTYEVAKRIEDDDTFISATLQHGGFYGMSKWSTPTFLAQGVHDQFLTWGWSDGDGTYPISHPRFTVKNTFLGGDGIVIVDNQIRRYFYKNWSHPVPGRSAERYLGSVFSFIEALDDLQLKTRVRQYYDYGWGFSDALSRQCPQVMMDTAPSFIESIKKAKVVVCFHNQTTFLEMLFWNKPLIVFWDQKDWELSSFGHDHIEALKRVHVFFDSSEEAGRFLKSHYADIDAWWYSDAVQAVRETIVNHVVKSNPNWLDDVMALSS